MTIGMNKVWTEIIGVGLSLTTVAMAVLTNAYLLTSGVCVLTIIYSMYHNDE